ncbi:hypothetical protein [Kitasatospora sp. NPDC004289]
MADGRRIAVAALKLRGPWSRAAARSSLAGSDQAVVDYVRSSWSEAAAQDERSEAGRLAVASEYAEVRSAAAAALAGDQAQVSAFLTTGRHQAAFSQYRVKASQLMETGGPRVRAAAATALEANTVESLLGFLDSGQYTARAADDQVLASQLVETGSGAEVRNAAAVAVESPGPVLSDFLAVGRHRAAQQDELTRAHDASVAGLIASGAQVAALARQDAALAAKAAAEANGAASDAQQAASDAQAFADQAAGHARDAKSSADQAEASAARARAAAAQARGAAAEAAASAARAQGAADRARDHASAAKASADDALVAVEQARESARNAGESAERTQQVMREALRRAALTAAVSAEFDRRDVEAFWNGDSDRRSAHPDLDWDTLSTFLRTVHKYGPFTPLPGEYEDFADYLEVAHTKLAALGLIPLTSTAAGWVDCGARGLEWLAGRGSGSDAGSGCAGAVFPVWGIYNSAKEVGGKLGEAAGWVGEKLGLLSPKRPQQTSFCWVGNGPQAPSTPSSKVPDDYVVAIGGVTRSQDRGQVFTGSMGKTGAEASAMLPNSQVQLTTAGAIRAAGGKVEYSPVDTPADYTNFHNVNITLGNTSPFGVREPNAVAPKDRFTLEAHGNAC